MSVIIWHVIEVKKCQPVILQMHNILNCNTLLGYGCDCSHKGRSILAVLPAMILAISRLSNNPTPSTCQSLFIIFATRRRCCLATDAQGGGGRGTLESTRAALSRAIAWLHQVCKDTDMSATNALTLAQDRDDEICGEPSCTASRLGAQ